MTTLKFADTHNMVAFLSKPAESEGFEQIVDFLNAHPIKHALTLQALVDGKKIIITESTVRRDLQLEDAEGVDCLPNATIFKQLALMRKPKRKDTQIPQSSSPTEHVADKTVYKELDDSLVRAATTASSLEAEPDSGNIIKTRSKATPNEAGSQGTTSGGGPRSQETMGDTIAQTRFENVSKLSNDLLLARVLDLEKTKTTQPEEIVSLKRRVKKLKHKKRSRTHGLKRFYKVGLIARVESSGDEESLGEEASKQGRINAIDADEDITLVNDQDDDDMFDVNTLAGEEVFVAEQSGNVIEEVVVVIDAASTILVSTATITDVEITLAQALAKLKSAKPKADKDKGKGIMIEEPVVEQVKPIKRLEQMRLDEELDFKLQAEEKEEERLTREKAQQIKEANIAWDDVQAKVEADYHKEKKITAKRAEEKRNRPPTRAQQRNIMCTYLKNMEGWKPKSLKNKSFTNIQELFEKAMKRVNTFVDYRTKLMEESSKKAKTKLEENLKNAKAEVMEDEEEVAIDVVPLAIKPPTIVDWKIHKEGKKSLWKVINVQSL
ncbi:hypothetical protein Tco_0429363 [Tanacetum coccineum]